MILHKIYDTAEKVKEDLQKFLTDTEKRKFLESVKEDKVNVIRSSPLLWEQTYESDNGNKYPYVFVILATDEVIKFCDNELEFLKKKIEIEDQAPFVKKEKITWKGSPSLFAFIFYELVKKGYIEPDLHNGEYNFTKLSKLLFEYFEIHSEPGKLTTSEYIKKQLSEDNALSSVKKAKFTIPDLRDLN